MYSEEKEKSRKAFLAYRSGARESANRALLPGGDTNPAEDAGHSSRLTVPRVCVTQTKGSWPYLRGY